MELIEQARGGNRRAVARLITQVENDPAAVQAIVRAIYPYTGRAHIVGITGPPGSGKSTAVNELAKTLRAEGRQVAIVAVDPSSPFTGGALLGDRVRMRDLSGDEGVFVRSMASRGSLGGLSRATSAVVQVLDVAGFDMILIETVGAGQAEVDIATTAHTTVVLEAPGMGDDIQSIKAGILEIADILVVNKADQPGAGRVIKSLELMIHLALDASPEAAHHHDANASPADNGRQESGPSWYVPVLSTVATTGQGVTELRDAIVRHGLYLRESGEWQARELARGRAEIERVLQHRVVSDVRAAVPADQQAALVTAVAERRLDPYTAADRLYALASPRRAAETY